MMTQAMPVFAPARQMAGYPAPSPQLPSAPPIAAPLILERAVQPAIIPDHETREFEVDTERQSRAMAERFAPSMALKVEPHQIVEARLEREPEIVLPTPVADVQPRGVALAPGGFFDRLTGGVRRHEPLSQHYKRPSLNLLKRVAVPGRKGEPDADKLIERSRLLLETLSDFGIKGEITAVRPGPVVTLFEFEPARGTKSSRVIALADDIARSMSARAVRIAVVPGVNAIGIELPNTAREPVGLRDLLETELFRKSDAKLPLALGKGIGGEPVVADLSRMPHLLVAGTTGAGKSVGVNAMILSLLYQLPPEECRLILIDPKMLELSVYNGIPHLLTPVVTDPNKAVAALNWAVSEMETRYKRMSALSVRNIEVYNNRVRNAKKRNDLHGGQGATPPAEGDFAPMPHIVIVVDEFADLMAVAGKEIEFAVQRLAQMARAAGIHLIMATQRPSVDIITGTIKANFPTRISFRVTSRIDSRTILNEQGAEQLLGQGDMLYAAGSGQIMRVHGPFVSDEEVEGIATYLRSLGAPDYVDGITDTPDIEATSKAVEALDEDDLYDRAVALVKADQKASISYLQRRLGIGYNRAADIVERMERDGLVGAANAAGKRELFLGKPIVPDEGATS
jgi:DNA segregation ATPase FtsK/SpoIIIE, S-DNA-T family